MENFPANAGAFSEEQLWKQLLPQHRPIMSGWALGQPHPGEAGSEPQAGVCERNTVLPAWESLGSTGCLSLGWSLTHPTDRPDCPRQSGYASLTPRVGSSVGLWVGAGGLLYVSQEICFLVTSLATKKPLVLSFKERGR